MVAAVTFLQTVFWLVLRATWYAAVVFLVALILSRLVGRRIPAGWHSFLWLLVFIRLLLPVAPQGSLSVGNILPDPTRYWQHAPENGTQHPPPLKRDADVVPQATPGDLSLPAVHAQRERMDPQAPSVSSSWPDVKLTLLLSLVWSAGALALATGWLGNSVRLCRMIRLSRPIQEHRLLQLAEACRREVGLRRLPALRYTPSHGSPAVAGVFRPLILLPSDAAIMDDLALRHVFLHEMRHIRTGDCLLSWILRALCIVHWFNPCAWLAARFWRHEREMACDAWVLRDANMLQRRQYGRTLLSMVEGAQLAETLRFLPGMISPNSLEQRIRHMQTFQQHSWTRCVMAAVVLTAVALLGLTDSSVAPAVAADEETTPLTSDTSAGEDAAEAAQPKPASPNAQAPKRKRASIIVAKHVILLDDKIVSWDELSAALRQGAAAGPLNVSANFSSGVFADFDMWNDRLMKLHKELKFKGLSFKFLSPPATLRYDAIRSVEDLKHDPGRRRGGFVLLPNGDPAANATVLIRAQGEPECAIYLVDGRVRDQIDEVLTQTDAAGRFSVYPTTDDFAIAVLHPQGFAAAAPRQLQQDQSIQLQPWGKVDLTVHPGKDIEQSAGLSVTVQPEGAAVPLHFQVFTAETEGQPVSNLEILPPGNVHVQRLLFHSGLSAGRLQVVSGKTERFELAPPTESEIQQARDIQARFQEGS